MKIGKKTKFGGPSRTFLQARGLASDTVRIHQNNKKFGFQYKSDQTHDDDLVTEAGTRDEVDDGSIKIYLDDERPCPQGWLLARNAREFFELMDRNDDFLNRVTDISLDWYLGSKSPDGMFVAKHLAEKFLGAYMLEDEPQHFLPNLKAVNFHSSDSDQARLMRTEIVQALEFTDKSRLDSIRLRLGPSTLSK